MYIHSFYDCHAPRVWLFHSSLRISKYGTVLIQFALSLDISLGPSFYYSEQKLWKPLASLITFNNLLFNFKKQILQSALKRSPGIIWASKRVGYIWQHSNNSNYWLIIDLKCHSSGDNMATVEWFCPCKLCFFDWWIIFYLLFIVLWNVFSHYVWI